jgi:hypothetical protein
MYLFYIYYLKNKEPTLLNGIESYVLGCLKEGSVNWIPILRSLSLERLNIGYGRDIEDEVFDEIDKGID